MANPDDDCADFRSGEYERQIRGCTTLIRRNRRNVDAYERRSGAYLALKKYDLAIADLTKAITLDKRAPVFLALVWRQRADVRIEKGDIKGAIEDLTKAIELNPRQSIYFRLRAKAYLKQNNLDFAIADFTKGIKLKPDIDNLYADRGAVYVEKGELDLGISDFTKAIEFATRVAKKTDHYFARAKIYGRKGDHKRRGNLSTIFDLEKPSVLGLWTRAREYEALGEWALAMRDYGNAIKLDPTDADSMFLQGRAYAQQGDASRALDSINAAIKLNLKETEYRLARAQLLLAMDSTEAAIQALNG